MSSPLVAQRLGTFMVLLLALFGASTRGLPVPLNAAEPTPTSQRQQQLQERSRLGVQARQLQAEGKLLEAIQAAEKKVALERQIFGDIHDDVADSLGFLAGLHERQADFAAARKLWQEALAIRTKLHGAEHWRTRDVRWAVTTLERLMQLGKEQQQQLVTASRLTRQVEQLGKTEKYAKALPLARQVLKIRSELLGEKHPHYAMSLKNLGWLYREKGDYARAESLYRRALQLLKETLGEEHPWYASTLNNLGWLYIRQRKFPDAEHCFQEAAAIYERTLGEKHPNYVQSLYNLGRSLGAQGDYAGARKYHEQVLDIRRKVLGEQHPDTAAALHNLGVNLSKQGDYAGARKYFEQALNIRRKVLGELHPDTTYSFHNLSLLLRSHGDHIAARKNCERAMEICRKVLGAQHPHTANAFNILGWLLDAQGDYAGAHQYFEQALSIRRKMLGERHPDTATSLHALGWLLSEQGDYADARAYYEQALDIRRKVLGEQHPDTATTLNNLGWLLREQGDYAGARKYGEQALDIRRKVLGEQHPDTATSLHNLGWLMSWQGDYAGARKYYEQALGIRRKVLGELHADTAGSLNNLGVLLSRQGDYAGACKYYQQALAIRRKVLGELHPRTVMSFNNLGAVLREQGNYAGARKYYEQALNIRRKVLGELHPETAGSLSSMGLLLKMQGNYAAARKYYEQALDIQRKVLGERHPQTANSLNSLGVLLYAQGDCVGARKYYEQALDIRRKTLGEHHPYTAAPLGNLGWLLKKQGDYAGARNYFEQALDITRRNLDLAATAQSEREQFLMTAMLRYRLDNFLSLTADTAFPTEAAYAHVIAWKGTVFAQQRRQHECNRLLATRTDPSLAHLLNDLQQTARQLTHLTLTIPEPIKQASWRQQLTALSERKEQLEREVARRSAIGRGQTGARNRLSVTQLRSALPADTVLIDFLETNQRLIAFVVRRGQPVRQVALGPTAPIYTALDRWRADLKRSRPVRDAADPAALLRAKVWQPLEAHLGDARVVLLSPDGLLAQLPFAALPGRDPHKYLIEEVATAIVPVPQLLPEMLAHKPAEAAENPTLLLLGEVDYDADPGKAPEDILVRVAPRERSGQDAKWKALPATREEVVAIKDTFSKRYRKGHVTELREEEATTATLQQQASKHRYLHLATHGFYADAKFRSTLEASSRGEMVLARSEVAGLHPGLLSGLVLAGANRPPAPDQEDGILTALEVAELDLGGVDLAVLSACETALGQSKRGEGVLGLQRSFQVAGAGTVVASLWSVDDAATRALMVRFYEHLWHKKKPLGKLEALCQAQREMLAEGFKRGMVRDAPEGEEKSNRVPPYYWAAFVLSGDWR